MRSLAIRAVTVLDAERLAYVHGECWKQSYRGLLSNELIDAKEERMRNIYPQALGNPGSASYWLATWDGEIVGFVVAEALGPGHERPLTLTSLYVLANYQGRGIGTKLLNHAIGTAPCLLWVLEGSKAASFYHRHGFEFDGAEEKRDRLEGARVLRMVR